MIVIGREVQNIGKKVMIKKIDKKSIIIYMSEFAKIRSELKLVSIIFVKE
jgi:hypothetical protein